MNRYAAAQAGKASSRPFRAIYVDGSLESTDVAAIGEIAAQLEVGWGGSSGAQIERGVYQRSVALAGSIS